MSHVYVDPAGTHYRPPNLIQGLMKYPSTISLAPQENQFTEALAWLIDRSDLFARRFAELFLPADVVAQARVIGTLTQVGLPKASGSGMVWPDLSVVGSERVFELFVEVKVDASLNEYTDIDGHEVILQPAYYIQAWKLLPPAAQAPSGASARSRTDSPFRPATTSGVRPMSAGVRSVTPFAPFWTTDSSRTLSTSHAIMSMRSTRASSRFPACRRRAMSPHLLSSAVPLLEEIAVTLATLADVQVHSKPMSYDGWSGMYLRLPSTLGLEPLLWIYVTPEGGKYNLFGQSDALCAWAMEAKDKHFADQGRVLAGGFEVKLDLTNWKWERLDFPLPTAEGAIDDIDQLAADLAAWIAQVLRACDPPLIPS